LKRDEVTGEWRRLHNEELFMLCIPHQTSFGLSRQKQRWAGYVARMEDRRGAYRPLVGKPEGRRPLERPRCRWEDSIKMDLREIGGGGA
jgi:hypothetical protein